MTATRDVFGANPLPSDIEDQIGTLAKHLEEIIPEIEKAREEDTARWEALKAERKDTAEKLQVLMEDKRKAEGKAEDEAIREETKALLASLRTPSKAALIGTMRPAHTGEYEKGSFISAVAALGAMREYDPEAKVAAKATLEAMTRYAEPTGKSTLGTTDATGGWVLTNAIVDTLIKPARYAANITRLVTTVSGMGNQEKVDIPLRLAAPSRAIVATWGSLKENVDLVYNGYTATMYTLARVYDITKQMLRKSAGAAEADVMGELAHGFALGEAYYILQGSGSSEPYGLQTALATIGTMTSAFTAGATNAGSMLKAVATAAGALAGRNRTPEAALVSAVNYWALLSQGTDNAGFWIDPSGGNATARAWGVPIYPENQLLGSDDLIVGEFSALKVYHGDGYRVDSTDIAGTRWDYNLVGFRGEMEMGLDARPAVYAGAFEFVADIVP